MAAAFGGLVWVYLAVTEKYISHPPASYAVPLIAMVLFLAQMFAFSRKDARAVRLFLTIVLTVFWATVLVDVTERLGWHAYAGLYIIAMLCEAFAAGDLIVALFPGPADE